jgi:hypothetical protein
MSILTDVVNVINNARDVEQSGEINKQASTDMFNGLLGTVEHDVNLTPEENRKFWESSLRVGEDMWCNENFGDISEAKHDKGKRAGEWKYRTILPNPYTSAKSVIGTAIELGIDPKGKGKTELQKAIKEKKEGKEESALDNAGKFTKYIDKAKALYDQVSDPAVKQACDDYILKVFNKE